MIKSQHQVLARKWRPRQFADVVAQTHVVRTLSNALTQSYLHHAYLFTGTRGVGKTTLARILAKCLNCESGVTAQPCNQCTACEEIDTGRFVDLIEVDAASRTKVEDTRELLDNVQYAPTKGRYKVYLIDEVHMLSGHSFNALLKTLEEPPPHVKFLLATTDPQRLPATILSRCLQFHLLAMSPEHISVHLQTILTQEHIESDLEALILLAKAADGSMRDALSLLDQAIAFGNGTVTAQDVKSMLGTMDAQILYKILHALADQDANAVLENIDGLVKQGADFSRALSDILSLLHQIAVLQAVPNIAADMNDDSLRLLAQRITREDVQLYYQIGVLGQRDFPWAPTARSGFEMTLLRMMAFAPGQSRTAATDQPEKVAKKQGVATETVQKQSPHTVSWESLIKALSLDGAVKMLADHCALKEFADSRLRLILPVKQKPLLQQKYIDRIRDAISRYYGRAITVEINLETHVTETPANLAQRQQEAQQRAAEKSIFSDPVVQQMMQTFDATVIKESITAKH